MTTEKKTFSSDAERKKYRIQQLWDRARKYTSKLMFQTRLQKMADSNILRS